MILTGDAIRQAVEADQITIDPFDEGQLNPNSYDLRLGTGLKIYDLAPTDGLVRTVTKQDAEGNPYIRTQQTFLDPSEPDLPVIELQIPKQGFTLQPGKLYLGHTEERAGSCHFVPRIDGRSSFGRLGLWIHVTAGFGDLGFLSQWTLEMVSVHPIRLFPGLRIAQISFHSVMGAIKSLYTGKYQGSEGVVESRVHLDSESTLVRDAPLPLAGEKST